MLILTSGLSIVSIQRYLGRLCTYSYYFQKTDDVQVNQWILDIAKLQSSEEVEILPTEAKEMINAIEEGPLIALVGLKSSPKPVS